MKKLLLGIATFALIAFVAIIKSPNTFRSLESKFESKFESKEDVIKEKDKKEESIIDSEEEEEEEGARGTKTWNNFSNDYFIMHYPGNWMAEDKTDTIKNLSDIVFTSKEEGEKVKIDVHAKQYPPLTTQMAKPTKTEKFILTDKSEIILNYYKSNDTDSVVATIENGENTFVFTGTSIDNNFEEIKNMLASFQTK